MPASTGNLAHRYQRLLVAIRRHSASPPDRPDIAWKSPISASALPAFVRKGRTRVDTVGDYTRLPQRLWVHLDFDFFRVILPLQLNMLHQRDLIQKFQIQRKNAFNFLKWLYVTFWHNLSLDERVRKSPFDPPPENEIKMSLSATVFFRYLRLSILLQHFGSVYVIYLFTQGAVKGPTIIMTLALLVLAASGIVCGAHRLWAHNSYKATWPLRVFLVLCQTMATQYSVFSWVRDHRLHHKFSDTELDPHNSNYGFFFSHIGWIMIGRTQRAKRELQKIWMDDIRSDKILMFQYYIYVPLVFIFSFVGPCFIPWYFWDEDLLISHLVVTHFRNVLVMHSTFTVNSLAHMWGMKPFDRFIKPVDSALVWFTTLGSEGWHNYHHAFPWDYKTSEYWGYRQGFSTAFIEFCAKLGLAYDLKTTSPEYTMKRRQKTGDLSCHVWGWNDVNLDPRDKEMAIICRTKDQ